MNTFALRHSLKTIPETSRKQYLLKLTDATENYGKRVLWKIFHAKNPNSKERINTFGFKTPRSPPMDEDVKPFLDELFGIIPMIKMRPSNNQFQKDLNKDVERILKCEDVLVNADKTENIYRKETN